MTDPTSLSPAAQAVLDAFRTSHTGQGCLVAALRAAAEQVVPMALCVHNDDLSYVRHQLQTIAAELDGTTTPVSKATNGTR